MSCPSSPGLDHGTANHYRRDDIHEPATWMGVTGVAIPEPLLRTTRRGGTTAKRTLTPFTLSLSKRYSNVRFVP